MVVTGINNHVTTLGKDMKRYLFAGVLAIAALMTGCATQTHASPPNPFYVLGQTEARAAIQNGGFTPVNGNPSQWCEVLWNGLSETSGIPAPDNSAVWTAGCESIAK